MAPTKYLVIAILVLSVLVAPTSANLWSRMRRLFMSMFRIPDTSNENTWPPEFYHEFEGPEYTVVQKYDDYEERSYSESRWATTYNYNQMQGRFWRMFWQRTAKNALGMDVDMTVPMLNKMMYRTDMYGNMYGIDSNRSMSFYIPDNVDLPTSMDPHVVVHTMPAMTVYVRSWTGDMAGGMSVRPDDNENEMHYQVLKEAIPSWYNYEDSWFYTATYDSDAKFIGRHNEVWIIGN